MQTVSAESAVQTARRYGKAKSRQDVTAALDCCTEDFVLETVAFRMRVAGHTQVAWDLQVFFEMFPDYEFICTGSAEGEGTVVLWGSAQMTWSGRLPRTFGRLAKLGRLPRRRIEVPAVAVFDVRDGLLARERFHFDMRDFCGQLGLPAAVVSVLLGRVEQQRLAAFTAEGHGHRTIAGPASS